MGVDSAMIDIHVGGNGDGFGGGINIHHPIEDADIGIGATFGGPYGNPTITGGGVTISFPIDF